MRRSLVVMLALGLLGSTWGSVFAQSPTYALHVENQSVSGTDFVFDIFLMKIGTVPVYLANADLSLTFNASAFTNPSVSNMASDLGASYARSIALVSGNQIVVNISPPSVEVPSDLAGVLAPSVVYPGALLARVKISGISSPSSMAGLAWHDSPTVATTVSCFDPAKPDSQLIVTNAAWHVPPDVTALPVTLVSFTGRPNPVAEGVLLEWSTSSEINNYGFTVQRKEAAAADFADLPGAFVAGRGTTIEPHAYAFVDRTVAAAGAYSYRLKQQDLDGTIHFSQSVVVTVSLTDVAGAAPKMFQLLQNYPNPFNPSTQVKFSVENSGRALVKVYSSLGEEVATLFDGPAEPGRYYVATFNAENRPSGMYFYRLTADQKTSVRRMLVVK